MHLTISRSLLLENPRETVRPAERRSPATPAAGADSGGSRPAPDRRSSSERAPRPSRTIRLLQDELRGANEALSIASSTATELDLLRSNDSIDRSAVASTIREVVAAAIRRLADLEAGRTDAPASAARSEWVALLGTALRAAEETFNQSGDPSAARAQALATTLRKIEREAGLAAGRIARDINDRISEQGSSGAPDDEPTPERTRHRMVLQRSAAVLAQANAAAVSAVSLLRF